MGSFTVFLFFSHQRTCEMQLISWKKNNPLKKNSEDIIALKKTHQSSVSQIPFSVLSGSERCPQKQQWQRPGLLRLLSVRYPLMWTSQPHTETCQQQSTLFNFCGKWESRMSFQRSLSSGLLFIINPHVLLLCLDTNRLALFRNVPSVWGKFDPK